MYLETNLDPPLRNPQNEAGDHLEDDDHSNSNDNGDSTV